MTSSASTSMTSSQPIISAETQDLQGPHALRVHLQMLDRGTKTIQNKSAPENAGTKHLAYSLSVTFPGIDLSATRSGTSHIAFQAIPASRRIIRRGSGEYQIAGI